MPFDFDLEDREEEEGETQDDGKWQISPGDMLDLASARGGMAKRERKRESETERPSRVAVMDDVNEGGSQEEARQGAGGGGMDEQEEQQRGDSSGADGEDK